MCLTVLGARLAKMDTTWPLPFKYLSLTHRKCEFSGRGRILRKDNARVVFFWNWQLKHKGWALETRRNPCSSWHMAEPGGRYAEWNKPVHRKTKTACLHFMRFLKWSDLWKQRTHRGGSTGECYSTGIKFQLGRMITSQRSALRHSACR